MPVGGRKYLLGVWDGLFEVWCDSDFFKTSRKDDSPTEVYYNSSDPLAAPPAAVKQKVRSCEEREISEAIHRHDITLTLRFAASRFARRSSLFTGLR